jgi:lysozyme family protein
VSFSKFLSLLPILEGGAWNDPAAGPTAALGITESEWRATGHDNWPPAQGEAAGWYSDTFWLPYHCEQLPEPADSVFMQLCINLPSDRRTALLQAAVGVFPDGIWGQATTFAIALTGNGRDLSALILAAQGAHYLDSQSPNLKGLMDRIAKVKKAISNGMLGG